MVITMMTIMIMMFSRADDEENMKVNMERNDIQFRKENRTQLMMVVMVMKLD